MKQSPSAGGMSDQQARIDTALEQLAQATDPAGIQAIMRAYIAGAPQVQRPQPRRARIIAEARAGWRGSTSGYVPFIRIRGRWLEKAGFAIGDDVTITATDGALVIRKAPPQEAEPC